MSAPTSTSPMASESWKLSSWYNVLPVRVSLQVKATITYLPKLSINIPVGIAGWQWWSGDMGWFGMFHHLVQLSSQSCQTPICLGRTWQPVEWPKSWSTLPMSPTTIVSLYCLPVISVHLRLEPLGFGGRRRHRCGRAHAGVAAHVLRLLYHEFLAASNSRSRGQRRALHPPAIFAWWQLRCYGLQISISISINLEAVTDMTMIHYWVNHAERIHDGKYCLFQYI